MRIEDLDFDLPQHLIAQQAIEPRDHARLMVLRRCGQTVEHRRVCDLPEILRRGDLMLMNQSKVVPARFYGRRRTTGGAIEGLFLCTDPADATWHVLLRSGGKLQVGDVVTLENGLAQLELLERYEDGSWQVARQSDLPSFELLEQVGRTPLPPYIERDQRGDAQDDWPDRSRYQTVYARDPGSVAAPTAGLHFTEDLLRQIDTLGVHRTMLTLHVGMGTFAPVRTEHLESHTMHSETYRIETETLRQVHEARRRGSRIIAVGTTSVRAIESLDEPLPAVAQQGATDLMIAPGYRFKHIDGMMTNFHLPRSTLLALVAAMIGLERLHEIYQLAVQEQYRFYSYGDAMLILPD